jgi:hypothetical protein
LFTAACSDDDANPVAPTAPGIAELRLGHLSPDAPSVDVRVNGDVVAAGVPFGVVSAYLPVPAGSTRIQVSPAGATEPVVIDATLELAADTAYSVIATGLLNAGDLGPIVLTDDRSTGPGAKTRFVHLGPDAPAVDIALAGGGPVVFGNVAFRESSDYTALDAGTYDLEVRVAGTQTVALPLPGVSLSPGVNYTIFAIGQLADGSLQALPAQDAP